MTLEQIAPIFVVSAFVAAFVLERLFPARQLPVVRGWYLRAFLVWIVAFAVNGIVPALVAEATLPYALVHLNIGLLPTAVFAWVASSFIGYWIHRSFHRSNRLWLAMHQLHHSAERVDIAGFAYTHPMELALQFGITTAATSMLGIGGEAAALSGMIGLGFGLVQHMNVRTPTWVGYLIQRPEQHAVHHQRGVHAYNYGDLPMWDLLFGTFQNPAEFAAEAGFWDGASAKLGKLLTARDVTALQSAR